MPILLVLPLALSLLGVASVACKDKPRAEASREGVSANPTVVGGPQEAAQPSRRQSATRLELRGLWLTNVDSQVLASGEVLRQAFAALDSLNFTTVYPVVWNRGRTLYSSEVVRGISGEAVDPAPEFASRDMVREALDAGVASDLKVVPWFEYGFKVPASGAFARARPGWLTRDAQGRTEKDLGGGVRMSWLNPLNKDVQRFYVDLLNEFVTKYKVTRLQFDDNFSIPADMLYDQETRAAYAAEGNGAPPASKTDPRWSKWVQWRASKISAAVVSMFLQVKTAHPGLRISLSPNPLNWAIANYLQDWKTWLAQGAVDDIVVQLYRPNMSSFESDLQDAALVAEKSRVAIGILAGLRPESKRMGMDLVRLQVDAARRAGYAGVSFFFYESLFHFPKVGETPEGRTNEIRNLFSELSKEPNGF
jgi:uncharacterized lipoprotein YddW (UPF0748 family)